MKNLFEKVGLPKGHVNPTLAYHEPTASIIAQTQPLKSVLPGHRLSFRRTSETRYRPVGNFPAEISIHSFALHARLPLLYFITYVWSEHVNGPVGGNWDALHCFNLETLRSKIIAHKGELVAPAGCQSSWLRNLFSLSDDGKVLFCKAAFQYEKDPVHSHPVHSCLARLSLSDRKLEVISRLEAIFA
jgi:hypothetical protein